MKFVLLGFGVVLGELNNRLCGLWLSLLVMFFNCCDVLLMLLVSVLKCGSVLYCMCVLRLFSVMLICLVVVLVLFRFDMRGLFGCISVFVDVIVWFILCIVFGSVVIVGLSCFVSVVVLLVVCCRFLVVVCNCLCILGDISVFVFFVVSLSCCSSMLLCFWIWLNRFGCIGICVIVFGDDGSGDRLCFVFFNCMNVMFVMFWKLRLL